METQVALAQPLVEQHGRSAGLGERRRGLAGPEEGRAHDRGGSHRSGTSVQPARQPLRLLTAQVGEGHVGIACLGQHPLGGSAPGVAPPAGPAAVTLLMISGLAPREGGTAA